MYPAFLCGMRAQKTFSFVLLLRSASYITEDTAAPNTPCTMFSGMESSAEENSIWAVKTMDVEINGKTVEISGQLENISGKALSFIDMNVSLLDCSGVIIGSGDAHILFETAIEDGNSADYRITIKNIRRPEDICEVDMNFSE